MNLCLKCKKLADANCGATVRLLPVEVQAAPVTRYGVAPRTHVLQMAARFQRGVTALTADGPLPASIGAKNGSTEVDHNSARKAQLSQTVGCVCFEYDRAA